MRQRAILDETRGRAIVVAAVIILASCGGADAERPGDAAAADTATEEEPTTAQEKTTAAEEETTTTTDPSTTTESASALSGIPVWLGRGEGQFVPVKAAVPFAFTAVGGWNSAGGVFNTEDRFTICAPVADAPSASGCPWGSVSVVRLGQGDIEATKAFLAAVEGAELSNEEPVDIGGAEGIRFTYTHEVRGTPGGQAQGDIDAPVAVDSGNEKMPIGFGPLGTGIVSIVDVAGETMVVSYQAYDASRGAVDDSFNTNLEEGLQIIDSVIWADLQ